MMNTQASSSTLRCSLLARRPSRAPQSRSQQQRSRRSTSPARAGAIVVRITTKRAADGVPPNFTVAKPARIAFDFPNTANALGRTSAGDRRGRAAQHERRAGRRPHAAGAQSAAPWSPRDAGRRATTLIITLSRPRRRAARPSAAWPSTSPRARRTRSTRCATSTSAAAAPAKGASWSSSSDANTGIDIRAAGPEHHRRLPQDRAAGESAASRLDVGDFATPVNTVSTFQQGENVRMVIEPKGQWEHNAYQTDTQFVRRGEADPVRPEHARAGHARPLHAARSCRSTSRTSKCARC